MEGVNESKGSQEEKKPVAYSQRKNRLFMGLNALMQIVLLLVGLVFLNVIVNFWYPQKFDLTQTNYYRLSDKTKALLKDLKKPVQIIVFFQPRTQTGDTSRIYQQVERLLNEYKYAQPKNIQLEYVDPDQDMIRARQLAEKYKVEIANVVVFVSGDRNKYVSSSDLVEYDRSDPLSSPRIKSFKGEQQFTSAIQSVVEGKQMKVYFLQGHGERDPDNYEEGGASTLAQYLRRDNLLTDKLSLIEKPEIPADCDLLIVDGPKQAFKEHELKLVEDYFKRQGRAFIMLDPETTTGLEDLLKKYRVLVGKNLIISKINMMGQEMYNSTAFGTSFASHPIVEKLQGRTLSFNFARTVQAIEDPTLGYKVTELVKTPESFWAETALTKKTRYEFNSNAGDIAGPLSLAVAVEPKTVSNVNTEGTRIVVAGTSSFVANGKVDAANIDFVLNSANWLLKRPQLIGISPKRPQEFILGLNSHQLMIIAIVIVGVMPFSAALLGFGVWFRRRK